MRGELWERIKYFFGFSSGQSSLSGVLSKTQKENNMISGIDLIKKYEGFRSQAYKCPAGIWTVGYGSTVYADGSKVKKGDTISEQTAEALLIDYLITLVGVLLLNLNASKH